MTYPLATAFYLSTDSTGYPLSLRAARTPLPALVVMVLAVYSTTATAKPLRIMSVGDSITVGYTDNPTWNVPFEFGYRSGLYTRLTNENYEFQFVGSSPEPFNNAFGDPTHGGTVNPALDLRAFGQDGHHGYGGQGIGFIDSNIGNWIAADTPDIILLLIGINGISTSSPGQLNSLVDTIVVAAPDAHVIVAQITPFSVYNSNVVNFNTHIRDTLVPTYAGNGFNVSTVDLYTMFLTDPGDPTSIGAGLHSNSGLGVHPSQIMYDQMAQAWFEGIEAVTTPEPSAATLLVCSLGILFFKRRPGAGFTRLPTGTQPQRIA